MSSYMASALILAGLGIAINILYVIVDTIFMVIYAYKWREAEYPMNARRSSMVVFDGTPINCNDTAQGIFAILTGVPLGTVYQMKCYVRCHDFDAALSVEKTRVHYLEFQWSNPGQQTLIDENYHALVYANGLLYQSFRTSRYLWQCSRWLHLHSVAYPAIQTVITDEGDRSYFERAVATRDADIAVFNRFCAPRSMPVQEGVRFVCLTHYTACVDPFRTSFTIPLMRADVLPGETQ